MQSLSDSTLVCLVLVLVTAAFLWGCGGEKNPAMSLQFSDRVFVLVDHGAQTPKAGDVGRVPSADLAAIFVRADADFGEAGTATAIVIYTNVRYVPAGSAYMPIRVRSLYETVRDDDEAAGIVVNPDVPGVESYALSDAHIEAAIPRIMDAKPLPVEIIVAGG